MSESDENIPNSAAQTIEPAAKASPESSATAVNAVAAPQAIVGNNPAGLQIEEVARQEGVVLQPEQITPATNNIDSLPNQESTPTPQETPPNPDLSGSQSISQSPAVSDIQSPPNPHPTPLPMGEGARAAIPPTKGLLSKLKAKLTSRTKNRLNKILELAKSKQSITNDDVEKLLRVSHATAYRYLGKLVTRGRLRRVGKLKQPKYQLAR